MSTATTMPSARRSRRGFTLVEIMVVVAIIGMVAMLAFPAILMSRASARNARFINDLRQAVTIFETYALQNGYYPDDAGAGAVPTDMEADLRPMHWTDPTAVGGQWEWDLDSHGVVAGVSVVAPEADDITMAKIDARIDDGSLSSGQFRQRDGGYIFAIE